VFSVDRMCSRMTMCVALRHSACVCIHIYVYMYVQAARQEALCVYLHTFYLHVRVRIFTYIFVYMYVQAARQKALEQLGWEVSDLLSELEDNYYATPPV